MVGQPFEPTPQGGRSTAVDGRQGDTSALPTLGFLVLVFAAFAFGAAVAQRRWKPLTAYLLTTPAIVVLAILVAESLSRLLPAWS